MPEPNSSTSSFKQFLIRILLPLIIFLIGGGYLLNYVFEKNIVLKSQACGAYKVNRIINHTYPDEIPIFGSSRAEGGFIPDSLGNNYFNYGISATKYNVTLFFMEEECKKKKNTPWILVNLDLTGLDYGIGDLSNYIPNSDYQPVRALMDTDYKPYFRIPLLRYYGYFETYLRAYMIDRIEVTKAINKGAILQKNELPRDQFEEMVNRRRHIATNFVYDTVLTRKLIQIISLNPARKFVFIVVPFHNSVFDNFPNLDVAYRFLDSLSSYNNVKVFDFSKMPLADSMYLNTWHINYKGAVAFNRLLRDSLEAAGIH